MASHRGPHPEDEELFAPDQLPRLRAAVHDLSWLRSRGYGDSSSLKLVGDRYALRRRQRNVVARSACSDAEKRSRSSRRLSVDALSGRWIHVDGFNVIIRVEGLLGGAYVFLGRDGAYRDVDPVAGTYRLVEETGPAIRLLRRTLQEVGVEGVRWWLDSHVSNVGRLKKELAAQSPRSLGWEIHVSSEVDRRLEQSRHPVATSDSAILDEVDHWCAIETGVLRRRRPARTVRDLRVRRSP